MIKTETLGLLRKYGISIYSSLDEQQLIDTRIIRTLIEAGEISPSDTVLEVGPGLGNITIKLMEMNCRVVAIEKNPKFIPILHERLCTNDNIEIIQGDVLKMPLPIFHVLISNTPYAIVEALMQRLKHVSFKIASIIVPKNFASLTDILDKCILKYDAGQRVSSSPYPPATVIPRILVSADSSLAPKQKISRSHK